MDDWFFLDIPWPQCLAIDVDCYHIQRSSRDHVCRRGRAWREVAYWFSYHESVILGRVGKWCAFGIPHLSVLHLDFNQHLVSRTKTHPWSSRDLAMYK